MFEAFGVEEIIFEFDNFYIFYPIGMQCIKYRDMVNLGEACFF